MSRSYKKAFLLALLSFSLIIFLANLAESSTTLYFDIIDNAHFFSPGCYNKYCGVECLKRADSLPPTACDISPLLSGGLFTKRECCDRAAASQGKTCKDYSFVETRRGDDKTICSQQNNLIVSTYSYTACDCSSGQTKCEGTHYSTCDNGCDWNDKGEVAGNCGVAGTGTSKKSHLFCKLRLPP